MRQLSILLLLAALAGCERDPVDRALVGTWQTAITSPTGAWQLRFTTLSNGQYRTEFQGAFAMPAETGYFAAGDGEWRIEKITGSIDEGTYEFLTDDSVLFQSPAGAVVWNRLATNAVGAPDAATTDAFAPTATPSAAIAPAPAPNDASVAATPSAELLATGPFGAALRQTPAFAPGTPLQPPASGAPGATPFGTPPAAAQPPGAAAAAFSLPAGMPVPPAPFGVLKPTPSPVFGSSNAAIVQSAALPAASGQAQPTVGATVGAVQQRVQSDVRTLADVPERALEDIQGAAEEAATDVIEQAAAPVAEAADEATRKVGQRIRNFFKRDRNRDDASEEEDR